MRGRIGTRLGWGSAGLGVGGSRLGWIGRGRGLIGLRQDWARWIGRGWGSTGARVHRGSGAGGLGVGARELERGLDWGVVGLGRGWIGCGWFGHDCGELMVSTGEWRWDGRVRRR